MLVSITFGDEYRISNLILSFHERVRPPLRPMGGTMKWFVKSVPDTS